MSSTTESPRGLPLRYDVYAHHARNLILRFHEKIKPSLPGGDLPPGFKRLKDLRIPRSAIHRPADGVTTVGILGAGAGGLYTALILDSLGIPYQILEARQVVGGRLFTYTFPKSTGAPYNYYDVGAMRFPRVPAMDRLYSLFSSVPGLSGKVGPYYFKAVSLNAFECYNGVVERESYQGPDPFFSAQVILDTSSVSSYIEAGTKAIVDDVISTFAGPLLADIAVYPMDKSTGWQNMQNFDKYSTRAYMSLAYTPSEYLQQTFQLPKAPLPTDVINWCETFDKSTGWYDRALSETVLEAIAFGWQQPLNPPPVKPPPPTEWHCIEGGAQQIALCMYDYLLSRQRPLPPVTFNSRVTAVSLIENQGTSYMEVVADKPYQFSHVISTLPLPVLRTIDLSQAGLSPMQSNALRELSYGPSIKIGMQFQTAWWTTAKDKDGNPLNIIGGQSFTDMPIRTIVYPSFGDVMDGKTTTLIASYCWTEDARRMGALIVNNRTDDPSKQPPPDPILMPLVLQELAIIHNVTVEFLEDQLIDFMAWDWCQDPLTMGAFAFFGPGKFEDLYRKLNSPAANGFLHFGGEALSVRHAWVEGALDSAWRAVSEMLTFPGFTQYQQAFYANWGTNLDWITTSSYQQGQVPKPEESLMLQHIAVMFPELFESD